MIDLALWLKALHIVAFAAWMAGRKWSLTKSARLSGPPLGAVNTSASGSCGRSASEAATSSATY